MSEKANQGLWARFTDWLNGSEYKPPDVGGFPIEIANDDTDFVGHLIVPTKQSGATIKQSGWRVGGDTISRTSSSGTVEEEPYEDLCAKFVVHEDHIEMGVMLDTGNRVLMKINRGEGPRRHMRIPLEDITDVRRTEVKSGMVSYPGFVFETAEDVYEVGFIWTGNSAIERNDNYDDAWLDTVVRKIADEADAATPL